MGNEERNTADSPPVDSEGRQIFNVISDTVTGVNLRWKDNIFQLVFIIVSLLAGIAVGFLLLPRERALGAIGGGFAGLLAGLFLSGFALMIFRAARHMTGRHD